MNINEIIAQVEDYEKLTMSHMSTSDSTLR